MNRLVNIKSAFQEARLRYTAIALCIVTVMVFAAAGCGRQEGEEEIKNVDDVEFCLNVSIENIDNTIFRINDFLGGLSNNLDDDKKNQELTNWLKSYSCIIDATVFRTVWSSSMQRSITEILISFNENGTSKELILDVLRENPLRAVGYHPHFYPNQVMVITKPGFTIDKVFHFINSFEHDVMYIANVAYNSTMSADNLIPIRDALIAKPYIVGPVGALHFLTGKITLNFWLRDIKNKEIQVDWFKTIDDYQLVEITEGRFDGNHIYFIVPEGTEKEWKEKFEKYDFVESVDFFYWVHN